MRRCCLLLSRSCGLLVMGTTSGSIITYTIEFSWSVLMDGRSNVLENPFLTPFLQQVLVEICHVPSIFYVLGTQLWSKRKHISELQRPFHVCGRSKHTAWTKRLSWSGVTLPANLHLFSSPSQLSNPKMSYLTLECFWGADLPSE